MADGPRSAPRSSQFCAMASDVGVMPVLLNVAASSVDFDSVYWTLAEKPLASRRRRVNCPAFRSEAPFDVTSTNPDGHAGHGLTAPAGYVFGRNACMR